MAKLLIRCLPVLLLSFLILAPGKGADACPFCNQEGKTLTGEVRDATMVLYAEIKKADPTTETSVILVENVVKAPDKAALAATCAKGKEVTIRGYHPPDKENKYRYLLFCDEFRGGIDPFYAVAVLKDSDISKYLKGALELKDAPQPKRLRFFFDYLDNADTEISNDAYREFAKADYADYKDIAKELPPDKIAGWLSAKDNKTPTFRYGLYASMLGHCGKDKHAQVLLDMINDKDKMQGPGADGILAAYMMLKPKEGFDLLKKNLSDPTKHFSVRYNSLKAVRFIWDYRSDLAKKKDMAEAVAQLITQEDIADMAIEDLRKWHCWDMADRVMALRKNKVYETKIVRRYILRFALDCKDSKSCSDYVAEMRKQDAEMVRDAEELLKLQQESIPGGK